MTPREGDRVRIRAAESLNFPRASLYRYGGRTGTVRTVMSAHEYGVQLERRHGLVWFHANELEVLP